MRWTLAYTEAAKGQLATIWMDSLDRQSVTDAADDVDRCLQFGPLNVGESRDAGNCLIIEPPLAVHFTVVPDDMLVTVFHVHEWQ